MEPHLVIHSHHQSTSERFEAAARKMSKVRTPRCAHPTGDYTCVERLHGIKSLPGALVGGLWPGERCVIGLRVCSWLRRELRSHCNKVLLKSHQLLDLHLQSNEAARIGCDMARHGRYAQSVGLVLAAPGKINRLDRNNFLASLEHALSESLHRNIELLDLRGSAMQDVGTSALASGLRKTRRLTFLDLSSNAIGPNGGANLALALEGCLTLQHLDLSSNRLGPRGAQVMASALGKCPSLQYLDMGWNDIGVEGAKSIAQALRQSTTLKHLSLAGNWVCSAGESLASALAHSESLTQLDLSSNSLYETGSSSLSLLATCPNLKHLNLAMNFLGTEGAISLSPWMQQCLALEYLDLSSNGFRAAGGQILSEAISHLTSLTHLDMSGNNCESEGTDSLLAKISTLPQLRSLDLGRNGLVRICGKREEWQRIASHLAHCSSLSHLQLYGNNLGGHGAEELALGLRECKLLSTLGMSNCALDDAGGAAVEELVGSSETLQRVDLQDNDIGAEQQSKMLRTCGSVRLGL